MTPEPGPAATIPRRSPGGDCPLSFAQQRLWFIDQLEPGRPTYNEQLALRLEGRLVPGALADAVTAIVTRHEALRTTFVTRDGIPVQVVHPPAPVAVREIDLTDVAADKREAALAQRLTEEAARPFDLTRDFMLRTVLFRLGPEPSYVGTPIWSEESHAEPDRGCSMRAASANTPAPCHSARLPTT